jgi:hypothetical protein
MKQFLETMWSVKGDEVSTATWLEGELMKYFKIKLAWSLCSELPIILSNAREN